MSTHPLHALDLPHLPWVGPMAPDQRPRASGGAGDCTPPARRATRRVLALAGPRLWPLTIEGSDAVPAAGPAILAANHRSFFDSVALTLAVSRPLTFVGKAEYLDSWTTRRLFPALGMIPIDRSGGRAAWGALEAATRVLDAGGLFAIYPEGTRSRDGLLHAGHRGVGHLAVTTGVPVVPVGLVGTERIQPPGARTPRPFRPATVRFGRPLAPGSYTGSARQRRRQLTADLMVAIADLSGQARAEDRAAATG